MKKIIIIINKNRGYISLSLSKLYEIRPRALPFIPFQQRVPHSNIGFAIRQASIPLFFCLHGTCSPWPFMPSIKMITCLIWQKNHDKRCRLMGQITKKFGWNMHQFTSRQCLFVTIFNEPNSISKDTLRYEDCP